MTPAMLQLKRSRIRRAEARQIMDDATRRVPEYNNRRSFLGPAWRDETARTLPAHFTQEASEALAVHHEHRERDLHLARDLARKSLQLATSGSRATAVRHRLTRLDRKLASPKPARRTGQATFSLFNPPF